MASLSRILFYLFSSLSALFPVFFFFFFLISTRVAYYFDVASCLFIVIQKKIGFSSLDFPHTFILCCVNNKTMSYTLVRKASSNFNVFFFHFLFHFRTKTKKNVWIMPMLYTIVDDTVRLILKMDYDFVRPVSSLTQENLAKLNVTENGH